MHKQGQGGSLDAVVELFLLYSQGSRCSVPVHVQYPISRCFMLATVCELGWLAQDPALLVNFILYDKISTIIAGLFHRP